MTDLKTDLAEVLARIDERTDGDYLTRLANGTNIALESANFLRDHGDELLAAVEDAERYRWLRAWSDRIVASPHDFDWRGNVRIPYGNGDYSLDAAIDAARVVAGNGGGEGH